MTRDYSRIPVTQLPGFKESLRILVEDEKYSMTDIGMMFDISRERVRQLIYKFNFKASEKRGSTGLFVTRVWLDSKHKFTPVRLPTTKILRSYQNKFKHKTLFQSRVAYITLCLTWFRETYNREPMWHELAYMFFMEYNYSPLAMIRCINYLPGARKLSSKGKAIRFIAVTGYKPWPPGGNRTRGKPYSLNELAHDFSAFDPLTSQTKLATLQLVRRVWK